MENNFNPIKLLAITLEVEAKFHIRLEARKKIGFLNLEHDNLSEFKRNNRASGVSKPREKKVSYVGKWTR